MSDDGTISGIPEESGTFTVKVAVWAEGCSTSTAEVTLIVAAAQEETPGGDEETPGGDEETPGGDEETPGGEGTEGGNCAGGGCGSAIGAGFAAVACSFVAILVVAAFRKIKK